MAYSLKLTRHQLATIAENVHDDEILALIVAAQAGEPLDDCLISEWPDHWPVINENLELTGEITDCMGPNFASYEDRAAIPRDVMRAAGWGFDELGYAAPPCKYVVLNDAYGCDTEPVTFAELLSYVADAGWDTTPRLRLNHDESRILDENGATVAVLEELATYQPPNGE